MAQDYVTGLTEEEEKKIDQAVKPIMSEHSITTMYSGFYMGFAKTIQKMGTAEAQIQLNLWSARGLNKDILVEIARDVCNKALV
jgi:hypothetical protein